VRRLALNLLTSSLTILLLVLLSLPALNAHRSAVATSQAAAVPMPAPKRLFGVYVDPWHLDEWSARVGTQPSLVATFEAFSRQRTRDAFLRQSEHVHVTRVMVSWEPWQPVSAALGWRGQAERQPGYTNAEIAAGAQDAYIARFARSLASFRGVVYLRYAHEMNGFWYPWSAGADSYVRAWRRIVGIMRREGAGNVRFVWSVNTNLYETRKAWLRNLRRYWPGDRYVDVVGSTMIDFGGAKDYTVARFEPALTILRRTFRKPVYLTEVNTDRATRVRWLRDLRRLVRLHGWVRAVVWSQLPSRGQIQRPSSVGDLNWDVTADPVGARELRAIARDGRR
jgi:hypothetical protein